MNRHDYKVAGLHQSAEFTLGELAAEIKEHLGAGDAKAREGLDQYRLAGKYLAQARGRVADGQWLNWLENNVPCSPRQAQRYIRLFTEWERLRCDTVSHRPPELSINDAMKIIAEDEAAEGVAAAEEPPGEDEATDESEPETDEQEQSNPPPNPATGALEPPREPEKKCAGCQRKGWVPGCGVCAALNAPPSVAGKGPAAAPPKPRSEPLVPFNWVTANEHLCKLLESVDVAAEAAGVKDRDDHKAVREKYTDAKEATSLWLKQLRAEAKK